MKGGKEKWKRADKVLREAKVKLINLNLKREGKKRKMKKVLKLITVLGLIVCCLLAFTGCNPAKEFAGEYELIVDSAYEKSIYVAFSGKLAPNELYSDNNLISAFNDIDAMLGTKVKLTAKYVLFYDSNTKFDVESYEFFKPNKVSHQYEDNSGLYVIKTNDEKLIIYIRAFRPAGTINISVGKYVTALDGNEYQCFIGGTMFTKGEN